MTERKWIGAKVRCFVRDPYGKRSRGFQYGIVRGVATNKAVVEQEGGQYYSATGLLVEIPDLGRHSVYGEWPVRFDDAEMYG